MFVELLVGTAGFTLGLYAGKRRAAGKGWGVIAGDMARSVCSMAQCAWQKLCVQFRKDDPNVVKGEIVDKSDTQDK